MYGNFNDFLVMHPEAKLINNNTNMLLINQDYVRYLGFIPFKWLLRDLEEGEELTLNVNCDIGGCFAFQLIDGTIFGFDYDNNKIKAEDMFDIELFVSRRQNNNKWKRGRRSNSNNKKRARKELEQCNFLQLEENDLPF